MFNISQGFQLKSAQWNFERDFFNDLASLKAASENDFPDLFITNVNGELYQLNKSNSVDATTGKWRKYIGSRTAVSIVDNLTSTSTTAALSANQGKVLKGLVDGKAATSHTHTKSQITDFPESMPANGGNSSTVNGKTVESNVPANAKFTDTTYTASTGLNLSGTAFSVKYGSAAGTACQGNDARLNVSNIKIDGTALGTATKNVSTRDFIVVNEILDDSFNNFQSTTGNVTQVSYWKGYIVGSNDSGQHFNNYSNKEQYGVVETVGTTTLPKLNTGATVFNKADGQLYYYDGTSLTAVLQGAYLIEVPEGTDKNDIFGLISVADYEKLDSIAEGANKYTLPVATSGARGGIKIGFAQTGKKYPVQLQNEQAYVEVPWSDTKYTLPTATSSVLGGVKVSSSNGLTMDNGQLKLILGSSLTISEDHIDVNVIPTEDIEALFA